MVDNGTNPILMAMLAFCYFALFVFVNAHLQEERMLGRVNSAPNRSLSAEPGRLRMKKASARWSDEDFTWLFP